MLQAASSCFEETSNRVANGCMGVMEQLDGTAAVGLDGTAGWNSWMEQLQWDWMLRDVTL